MVGGKQVHAPCEILLLKQSLFLCQSHLMKIIQLLTEMRHNLPTLSFGDISGFEIVVSVCLYSVMSKIIYVLYSIMAKIIHVLHSIMTKIVYVLCNIMTRIIYVLFSVMTKIICAVWCHG